jgi:hypothetical protein
VLSGPKWERAKEWKIEIVSKDWMWEKVVDEDVVAPSIAPPTAPSTTLSASPSTIPSTIPSTTPSTTLSTTPSIATSSKKKQRKNITADPSETSSGSEAPGKTPAAGEVPGKTLAALKELADMPDMVSSKNSFKVKRKRGNILRDTDTNVASKTPTLSGVDDVEGSQFIGWA